MTPKKVNNRFGLLEPRVRHRLGRLDTTRNIIWQTLGSHPTDFRFDRRVFLPGGMPDTIWGSKISKSAQNGPIYPMFVYVGVCFPAFVYLV